MRIHRIVRVAVHGMGGARTAFRHARTGRNPLGRNPLRIVLLLCLLFTALRPVFADGDEVDRDKLHVRALWWFSKPSGFFKSSANEGGDSIDLQRDLGFGSYSTFSGNVDWRFARKHHLIFAASPVSSTRTTTLSRTIDFEGTTYHVGAQVSTQVHSFLFAPGYQWDFIRRKQGYLALSAGLNVLDTSAEITGTATVNGQTGVRTAKGSVIAPIPVLGPRARWFPIPGSRRFDVDGGVQGMYLFGYGDFWSGRAMADIAFTRHWYFTAGYQLGTRLSVHGSDNQTGVRLTQKGPVAGVQASW